MSERDIHFKNAAKCLSEEMRRLWRERSRPFTEEDWPLYQQQAERLIVHFAYDLVAHTIDSTSHHDLDVHSTEEHVTRIPDLEEWPLA